ncbi:MAG TPA: P1 family peptidase [Hypericibacter adhaerens]|jgi:L-aminopeptidase/D-esterase-like protein|uniref:Peptidase T4 n=1 Tax=Hypericibacter adhaerens TaxID=2602016 RepID=A0A5J6MSW9_9PROT|nr:P1 family peptidase [Hypericibacter adhaerens]QEX20361.1 peptidase T4 [Hypericibacter adhaerens]HWA46585.1 P1 family peptidase [Hypericibacter adhaerens]
MTGIRPGPRNLITDIGGLKVGQAHDARVRTGVTVVLPDRPAVCACDVRGGGPGTRETDLLAADTLVEAVDALVLSGGSVYGLGAADGVVAALGAAGRGYSVGEGAKPAPIVPAAILFDLANSGDKNWGDRPPYGELGRQALAAADRAFELGVAGAGYGAKAGTLKGGIGSTSLVDDSGIAVGALVAVNAVGSVVMPGSDAFWAWPFEIDGEFGGARPDPRRPMAPDDWGAAKASPALRQNTTIAVVATNVALTPAQARRLAIMAQDGLSRAIRPVHTLFDGDVVFALSTGARPLAEPWALTLSVLGERAANCLARAVARGVFAARG